MARAGLPLLGVVDDALAPLDAARAWLLARAVAIPGGRTLVARRSARVVAMASLGLVVSAVLTVACPVALFVLVPLALGVPHLAADVRYLVLRRGPSAPVARLFLAGCAALFAVRALAELHLVTPAVALRLEPAIALAWALGAAALGAASSATPSVRRAGTVVAVLVTLGLASLWAPFGSRLVFAHAHNLVAVLAWVWLFRRPRRAAIAPLALLAVLVAALLACAGLAWTFRLHGETAFGVSLFAISDWLAPGLSSRWALGLTYSYVFLQSVHYAVWLGLVPQEDLRGQGTITFRMSARGWARDFGVLGLAAIALATAGFAVAGLFHAARARDLYVSLATFHGYLEIAAIAWLVARGEPAARRARPPLAAEPAA